MKTNRRNFLKSASVAGAGMVFIPGLFSCKRKSPNEKLNVAVIGVGGKGPANWRRCLENNIVAFCDVDDERAIPGYKQLPDVPRFKDFRVMFDKMHKNIDAVVISTPDHSHFAAAIVAMQLGKHVYVEKPLAHNIWQVRTMAKAAKYYGVVSQMGNQGHTTEGIRFIKEWYDAGVLGEVKEVLAWVRGPRIDKAQTYKTPEAFPPPAQPVPEHLDWDLWLANKPFKDYNSVYVPAAWRGFYDFGSGELGDWACHTLDGPFWALELGSPELIWTEKKSPVIDNSFVAAQSIVCYKFPARGNKPPVVLKWHEGGLKPEIRPEWGVDRLPSSGMIMVGSKKSLITGARPNKPHLMVTDDEWNHFLENMPEKVIPRAPEENPQKEWLDAIKNDTLPGSNFDYASSLTEMALVGVISQKLNKEIEYDAKNMRITNHTGMEPYIKEPVRKGWEYGEDLWK